MSDIFKEAELIKQELIENRRYLHMHPETGFDTVETASFVKKKLTEMGYEPVDCGKGVVAIIGNGAPTCMIRADMDALPMAEEADVEYRSDNGKMHACGHDMHTTMLLGAARILKKYESSLNGTIKLMFQPAEEIFCGSKNMIEAGVLEAPKVDLALMLHVMTSVPFKTGSVMVSAPGVSAPAADYFEIIVKGKGCHGAMPESGVDPLNAAAHILIALQEINAREIASADRAVLTVTTMQTGTASNVIPDEVRMGGTLRAYDEDVREFMKKRTEEIASSVATAFRAQAEVVWSNGCKTLINDRKMSETAVEKLSELLGEDMVIDAAKQNMPKASGSEDFAYVSHEVPSLMLAVAAGKKDEGYEYPLHHPKAKLDEDALVYGSAIYAFMAIELTK